MLSKLALRNVKRQVGNYLIYFMTVSFTVAMLFALSNIIFSENLARFTTNKALSSGLLGTVIFISAIVAFVLSYATSFMLKLRKREFGTYLTLGMTRKNILFIFISETTFMCSFALALGLGIGVFIYQGLTSVMMNLLEMQFSIASYSPKGLLLTIALVIGIFLIASLASSIYLKKVSIYDLVHSNQNVNKPIKHPVVWFAITVTSLALLVGSLVYFNEAMKDIIMHNASAIGMMVSIMVFAVSVILFHIGLARSIIYVLLKRKKLCSKSTNTFVLRQLSSSLGSNSIMLGFLAFLLSFAVIGTNFAFVEKSTQEVALNEQYPFDIEYSDNIDFGSTGMHNDINNKFSVDQAETIIEKYVGIEKKYPYKLYASGGNDFYNQTEWSGDGYEMVKDSFMKLSDFNSLLKPLGLEEVKLDNEYMIISNVPKLQSVNWADFSYNRGGVSYTFDSIASNYPMFCFIYFYVIIPDEAVKDMEIQGNYISYDTEDGTYDALALKKELTYTTPSEYGDGGSIERCDYSLRELGKQQGNSQNAIFIIGALFVATVFLFMAMAILALKTLSTLNDDKRKYSILFRLGASQKEMKRALFRQTFSFIIMPFAVPFLLSIPIAIILQGLMKLTEMSTLVDQVPIIASATAGVMSLMYLLYYTATYFIAKRAVIKDDF